MVTRSKVCLTCGKKFKPENRKQKYCSNACQSTLPAYYRWLKCVVCGKWFQPATRRSETCGPCSCAWAGSRGRFIILERDNFTCAYCGRSSFEDYAELHIDHVVPKSQHGLGDASNLITSCRQCNSEKGGTPLKNPEIILGQIRKRNDEFNIPQGLNVRLDSNKSTG